MKLVFVLQDVVLNDYRTWNTLTRDTFKSQRSPSSYKRSSSDIRQSALETRGTASPCYAFRGELVREVHGSPLNLHEPIPDRALAAPARSCPTKRSVPPPRWGLRREL
jgi:hypothetical protein